MAMSRYQFGILLARWWKRKFGRDDDVVLAGRLMDPRRLADIFWGAATIICIILSAVSLWFFGVLYGQLGLAIVWGVYFGFLFLTYIGDKWTTAILGGAVGASWDDIRTFATTGLADSIKKISTSINQLQQSVKTSTHFVIFTPAVWLLLFIFGLFALWALIRTSSTSSPTGGDNPNANQ